MRLLKLFMLFSLLSLTACAGREYSHPRGISQGDAALMTQKNSSYELYSWKSGETWSFVLIPGSTNFQTFAEITVKYDVIDGVDAMIQKINALAPGCTVFWNLRQIEGFDFPPRRDLARVMQAARDRGIDLEAIERF
ncbi:MAG: hypothetical protein WCS77_04070 [Elusimicrobiaceae bacterium]|jgi:hypothetical protein